MFASTRIIDDQMNVQLAENTFITFINLTPKSSKALIAITGLALSRQLSSGNVAGCKSSRRPIPDGVMCHVFHGINSRRHH
jgi:hypothetical protein